MNPGRRQTKSRPRDALLTVQTEVTVEYNGEQWPAVVLRRYDARADVRYHPHRGVKGSSYENGLPLSRLTFVSAPSPPAERAEARAEIRAEAQLALLLGPGAPPAPRERVRPKTDSKKAAWIAEMKADDQLSGWSFSASSRTNGGFSRKLFDPTGRLFRSHRSALASLAPSAASGAPKAPRASLSAASPPKRPVGRPQKKKRPAAARVTAKQPVGHSRKRFKTALESLPKTDHRTAATARLEVGALISVQYPEVGGKAYRATVAKVRSNGTFDVQYPASGTAEDSVELDRITRRTAKQISTLEVGALISVQYPEVGGKAYGATVAKVRSNGTVDVQYPASGTAEDSVELDRITLRFYV